MPDLWPTFGNVFDTLCLSNPMQWTALNNNDAVGTNSKGAWQVGEFQAGVGNNDPTTYPWDGFYMSIAGGTDAQSSRYLIDISTSGATDVAIANILYSMYTGNGSPNIGTPFAQVGYWPVHVPAGTLFYARIATSFAPPSDTFHPVQVRLFGVRGSQHGDSWMRSGRIQQLGNTSASAPITLTATSANTAGSWVTLGTTSDGIRAVCVRACNLTSTAMTGARVIELGVSSTSLGYKWFFPYADTMHALANRWFPVNLPAGVSLQGRVTSSTSGTTSVGLSAFGVR